MSSAISDIKFRAKFEALVAAGRLVGTQTIIESPTGAPKMIRTKNKGIMTFLYHNCQIEPVMTAGA